MLRVLQTLALPLGHDAMQTTRIANWMFHQSAILRLLSGRWDSNPRPSPWQGDALPTEPLPLEARPPAFGGAESQNRTGDTAIFSRVLYQLSYLGKFILLLSVRDFTRTYMDCQEM